jgi:hypothetical protein
MKRNVVMRREDRGIIETKWIEKETLDFRFQKWFLSPGNLDAYPDKA